MKHPLSRPEGMPLPFRATLLQYLPARVPAALAEVGAVGLFWVAAIVLASQMLQPFTKAYAVAPGSVMLAVIAGYALVALWRGHLGMLAGVALYLGWLLGECVLFSLHAGVRVNVDNALVQVMVLALVVFRECRLPLGVVLRIATACCLGYLAVYVGLNHVLVKLPSAGSALVLGGAAGRGARVFLVFEVAFFVLVQGCLRIWRTPLRGLAMAALAVAAIALAGSRVLTLAAAGVLPLALVSMWLPGTRRVFLIAVSVVWLGLAAHGVAGYAVSGLNPYAMMRGDESGRARYLEFADARAAMRGHIAFGVGLPPDQVTLNSYTQSVRPFYASDLGVAGVFFSFGVVGILGFVGWSLLCLHAMPWPMARRTPAAHALMWTCVFAAAVGWFTPDVIGPSGAAFVGMLMGVWLKNGVPPRPRVLALRAEIDPRARRLRAYAVPPAA